MFFIRCQQGHKSCWINLLHQLLCLLGTHHLPKIHPNFNQMLILFIYFSIIFNFNFSYYKMNQFHYFYVLNIMEFQFQNLEFLQMVFSFRNLFLNYSQVFLTIFLHLYLFLILNPLFFLFFKYYWAFFISLIFLIQHLPPFQLPFLYFEATFFILSNIPQLWMNLD